MKSIFIHLKQGLIALILLTSCENFLDLDTPNTQLVSAEVFEDKKTTDAALLNIYASLRDNGLFTGNNSGMTYLLGLYTDELDLYSINLLGQKEFYEHTLSTRNELVLTTWNTSYNQIYRLNALIEGVEKSTLLENQYKQTVLAEAYTMRGMLHMYLTQLFGEIPYITTTDYLQNKIVHKTPEKEIYERIEQDYLTAEELFLKGTKNTSKTRLNLTSLKTLKAKKNMMYFDMLLMAVRPDYQNKGINAIFFHNTSKYFKQYGVKYAETTSILETNNKSQANFEEYEKIQHKRRRAYLKPIA